MGRRPVPQTRLRRTAPLAATVASAVAVLGAALLPWLRTGEARRSAFSLARAAQGLGLFEGWSRRLVIGLWFLVPLLVAATWTAGALRRPMLVATLGGFVGAMSVAAGWVVQASVPGQVGPVAGMVSGALALVSASWLALETAKARVPRRRETERSSS